MERKQRKIKPRNAAWVRAFSFPPELHGTLAELAKQKKVSLAWVEVFLELDAAHAAASFSVCDGATSKAIA